MTFNENTRRGENAQIYFYSQILTWMKTNFLRRLIIENYLFFIWCTRDTSQNFSTSSSKYLSCFLQCKIPVDNLFFCCQLKPERVDGALQNRKLGGRDILVNERSLGIGVLMVIEKIGKRWWKQKLNFKYPFKIKALTKFISLENEKWGYIFAHFCSIFLIFFH